ncbi:hypothetical protein DMC30DRAFT_444338 [Rhodotorula diobovata]|uniref:ELYS-like domain-containing protein n=1 Tax=Rhodotorula diobovata TaxID=5288 RepID=A0A5C5G531_9BASI|nr:hypothetical protein DMC30DRAFT_444338 [Rhodotorula diobovata]
MDSSQESFVVVSPTPPSVPPSLARFFPSLSLSLNDHADLAHDVEHRRANQPDARLFIDHLVKLALPNDDDHSDHGTLFPQDVASLLGRLARASSSPVARSCLYYLALALSGPSLARDLALDLVLPVPFRLATKALFLLDSGHHRLALRLLADPRVQPDFVPRTFAVLAATPHDPRDRADLVLSYWRLARIDLVQHSSAECRHVLRALCAPERPRGVHEAWQLARTWHVEGERDGLAATILETCFGANHSGLPLSAHLSALMVVPFLPSEDRLANTFCASPPPPLFLTLTVDWRLSKLVAESRPVDALRFSARVRRDQGDKLAPSDARDRLLKAVEANLTDVQRSTLELDLAAAAAPAPSTTSSSAAQALQPAPPPAAPTAADLPLSASPFVRSQAGAQQGGVLRALEHAQGTPRKVAPSAAPGSPFVVQQRGAAAPVSAGTPARAGAAVGAEQQQQQKPTLPGFGSVRQAALTSSVLASPAATPRGRAPAPGTAEKAKTRDADEDDDGDEEMQSPTAAHDDDDGDAGFARRAALDPAVQRTIAAASASASASAAPRRAASGSAGKASEPTKRRAVARRAPHEREVDRERSSARTRTGKGPQTGGGKPPGAFPSSSAAGDDDETQDEQDDEQDDDEPAPAPAQRSRAARTAATTTPARPRRSARASASAAGSSRAGTAEPASPPPTATAGRRRATRAGSAAPGESALQLQPQQTPVRRSSRLSGMGSAAGKGQGEGTGTARRATRGGKGARGRGKIEEDSDEE